MKITKRQKLVLKKIYKFILENGYPPTIRELAEELGFSSPKAASDHLKSLERKGYLKRNSSARSIKLTSQTLNLPNFAGEEKVLNLPLVGRIAAGKPILAGENIEEYITIPASLLTKSRADFALKVKGDSMTGDHILDGDIIIVKSQNTAENGDIVVAIIEDEAAVKKFYKEEKSSVVELRSSNPSYKTIKITKDKDIAIQGKVVAVLRNIP